MAVYPRGKRFMASVGTGPERVRKTFKLESEAKLWEKAQEGAREAVRAAPTPVAPAVSGWTLQKAFDDTSRHVWKDNGGAAKARLNAGQALKFFGSDTPCSEITASRALEWVEELQDEFQNSGSTINKKLSALTMMLRQAEQFGGLQAVPKFRRYDNGEHRIIWYSEADEAAMLKACSNLGFHELDEFIVLGIDTGFRRSELLHLRMADYVGGLLVLHAGATKAGMARSVPVEGRVAAILERKRQQGADKVFSLTVAGLRRQWEDLRRYMGKNDDPGFIIHCLRHTCATRMVTAGVPLDAVKAWMGHGTIQTTMRYAHFMPARLTAASAMMQASRSAHLSREAHEGHSVHPGSACPGLRPLTGGVPASRSGV